MRNHLFLLILFIVFGTELFSQSTELQRWQDQAARVEIIRDTWGIPHVYGQTDADAVFGMLYVQCEDDFRRVERNYLDAVGRMAEAYGEEYVYHDLRARMFMDVSDAIKLYSDSPGWLKKLCRAFADGINFYLHTHPDVKPDLITRFEPWMPFFFSEGSIGGDITRISLSNLKAFYENGDMGTLEMPSPLDAEPTGSNGFSIAPAKSKKGHSLFLINPHTSYYFRSELHINSEEGLHAYGAATWGQFFVYQGFNENCGWMHTSTYADAIDQYKETVKWTDGRAYYKYGKEWRPVTEHTAVIPFTKNGKLLEREFTIYKTHHGPVVGKAGEDWITFRMMERPADALRQSFLRTKAKGYRSFKKTMKIRTNSSNNTVYADKDGNIAYWHGNFIPKRNPAYDYNGIVDGSNPETDWKGLHRLNQMIHVKNPSTGWIQNCNATPFTVAGASSPDRNKFAAYIAPDSENYRGINAVRVLESRNMYSLTDLIDAANDPTLTAFEVLIPALLKSGVNKAAAIDKKALATLSGWNYDYGEESVGTTLAIFWAEELLSFARENSTADERRSMMMADYMVEFTSDEEKVSAFAAALDKLTEDFGSWDMPWGQVNRFQRLTGQIEEKYDDEAVSIPVGFTSSRWGSLASFGARTFPNTKKRYGTGGNSFVAVVEFGDKLIAKSIVSGGQSNVPGSAHFTDQAAMFCKGQFKEVYYYKEDILENAEVQYRPGAGMSE